MRTIFNALGPLANPARATHQLIGVYDDTLRGVFARALGQLGVMRAWVVRSEDGLDEVSPSAPTRVTELSEGRVREFVVCPEDFGVTRAPRESIAGGDARANADAIESLMHGRPHSARDAVVLNAAAALVVAKGLPLREAAAMARRSMQDGAALATLDRWRRAAAKAREA